MPDIQKQLDEMKDRIEDNSYPNECSFNGLKLENAFIGIDQCWGDINKNQETIKNMERSIQYLKDMVAQLYNRVEELEQ